MVRVCRTIRHNIEDGNRIIAYCGSRPGEWCNHSEYVDLEALAMRLGDDFELSAQTINWRLRCSKCGAKNSSIRVQVETSPQAIRDRIRRREGR